MKSPLQMRIGRCLHKQIACLHQRRPFTASCRHSQATASEAASRLLDEFASSVFVRRQIIDGNQLQKLALTLGRPHLDGVDVSSTAPGPGLQVPPAYHLVYFTPNGLESELGQDGSDRTYNTSAPFTRRMWAGGKMKWPAATSSDGDGAALRVGDQVEERTKLLSAVPKKSRSAGEMVLVEVEKEIWGPRGLALVDQRSWVFRPEVDPVTADARPEPVGTRFTGPTTIHDVAGSGDGFPTRQLCWSPVGLFRFSALTFNGHKIHYNQDWTQVVEGHPGVVVHGPLNLINLLDYWRDVHGKGRWPGHVSYRALSPVYAGETYQIRTEPVGEDGRGKTWEVVADKEGRICMKAEIAI